MAWYPLYKNFNCIVIILWKIVNPLGINPKIYSLMGMTWKKKGSLFMLSADN